MTTHVIHVNLCHQVWEVLAVCIILIVIIAATIILLDFCVKASLALFFGPYLSAAIKHHGYAKEL